MASHLNCRLFFLLFLSLFISSCTTIGVNEKSIKEMSITVNKDDSDIFEEREYTVLNDQGDHLEELVRNGFFRKAARLYDKYNKSYFQEKGVFAQETRKEKYADYLKVVADHLNGYFREKIEDAYASIGSYTIWPSPPQQWEPIRNDINLSQEITNEYNSFSLLNEDQHRNPGIEKLRRHTQILINKLKSHASNSFLKYDFFNGNDFFDHYPYDIPDKNGIFSSNLNFIVEKLSHASCADIESFSKTYKRYTNLDSSCLIGDLYVETFIEENKKHENTENLDLLLDAIKAVNDIGLTIQEIKGQHVSFVESTSQTLLDEGYIEFPAEVNVDLPFPHKTCLLEKAFSEAADSNFVIVFNVAQASVKRRIQKRDLIKSKYLAGYKEVSNPNYRKAVVTRREVEMRLMSAQNRSCGSGDLGAVCELVNTIAIIGWKKKLRAANQAYLNTPEYRQEEVHKDYKFSVSNVEVTKSMTVSYYVLDRINKKYFKSMFDASEEKVFKVAYSLKDEDTNLYNHMSTYNSEEDIESFENKAITVNLSTLMQDYLTNIDKTKKLLSEKKLRAEMLKDKNVALAKYKQEKYSTKSLNDPRFNNVVVIYNPEGAIGSGFYVTPNLVLTNYHVVEGSKFIEMKLHNGLETFGKVVKSDVRLDLALIKVKARGEAVNFYGSNIIELGTEVEAIGHPSGLDFSITRGVVSAIRKRKSVFDTAGKGILFVQTDAAINPGNSGGPLFLKGKVIGVNNQKIVADAVEGLGFAIHYSEVQNFLKEDY